MTRQLAIVVVFVVSSSSLPLQGLIPSAKVSAAPGDGHMLLFWDGGTAPTGWTCVSCTGGDAFYQVFPRGNDTYGGTGGTATHTHTSSDSIGSASGSPNGELKAGPDTSVQAHTHSVSVTQGSASTLPSYRQLKIIRSDTAGEPGTIPANAIALFDATVPGGWSGYSAQNGYYPRGEGSITTGGSNTHNHSLTITIGNASGGTYDSRVGGSQITTSAAAHSHTASGNSDTVNQEPAFIETIYGQISSDGSPPDGMLAMWDNDEPTNWSKQSGSGGSFYQVFPKAAASYGTTGGGANHNHADTNVVSSVPTTTISARSGSSTSVDTHTHTATVASYSNEANLPPYKDVIIAKRVAQPDFEQASYRFFKNDDSTDVGTALSAQDSSATTPRQGTPFRLRVNLHITTAELSLSGKSFKLQIAPRSGTCDTGFIGESYADVASDSGVIRYYNNTTPADGSNLTTNASDPTHSSDTINAQTYEESNNFTNSNSTVPIGEDGLWDFSLVDNSATASTNFCFRVVESTGTVLTTYTQIPEILTDDGNGHMVLLFDGGTVPAGWSCVSCVSGDDFYQKFFRGEAAYGATGGAASHSHTASASIATTAGNTIEDQAGSGVATGGHTHTLSPTIDSLSSLPTYRQLKVIRADNSGAVNAPAGSIAFFDATVPAGWTRYSTQDGSYVRSEGTVGTTGGSLTHNHTASGTTSAGVGSTGARTTGSTQSSSSDSHTHTLSGSIGSISNEAPFRDTVLGKTASSVAVPVNIITIWDGTIPGTWTNVSSSGQPYYQNFVKPAATYSATGGAATHSPGNVNIATSVPDATGTHRGGSANSGGTHTHTASVTSVSTESNLPPYIDVIFAKLGTVSVAPDSPTNLDQIRTSDSSSITVGEWANSNEVRFEADATDTDNPDDLQLCVEVELVGTAFDNADTLCGSAVSYSGTAVMVSVTVSGLINTSNYHWQVRIKDSGGLFSSYVSFGANAESADDFVMDSVSPSGTVYDGSTVSVDIEYNDGTLDELDANWDITDGTSGVSLYEYSIGTTQGGLDVVGWTGNGTTSSVTVNSLSLQTSRAYYFNIRTTDNAHNLDITSSDGQFVSPTFSFSTGAGAVTFNNLNTSNSYTDTETTTITTSTNAYSGYVVRLRATALLQTAVGDSIGLFDGGTYASPDEWLGGDTGYGYTSSDTLVQGVNIFNPATCAGGGSSPCYAPFSLTAPGDIVADNTSVITGTPITDEAFTITHRVTTTSGQEAGNYTTVLVFSASAIY